MENNGDVPIGLGHILSVFSMHECFYEARVINNLLSGHWPFSSGGNKGLLVMLGYMSALITKLGPQN